MAAVGAAVIVSNIVLVCIEQKPFPVVSTTSAIGDNAMSAAVGVYTAFIEVGFAIIPVPLDVVQFMPLASVKAPFIVTGVSALAHLD